MLPQFVLFYDLSYVIKLNINMFNKQTLHNIPDIKLDISKGRISICNILIRISPGKLIKLMVPEDGLCVRPAKPMMIPKMTPITVITICRFSFTLIQFHSCIICT